MMRPTVYEWWTEDGESGGEVRLSFDEDGVSIRVMGGDVILDPTDARGAIDALKAAAEAAWPDFDFDTPEQ